MKRTFQLILAVFLCVNLYAQDSESLEAFNDEPDRFRGVIEKFREDFGSLDRFYTARTSANRLARFREFYGSWQTWLTQQDFSKLNHDEKVDYILFRNYLEHEQMESVRFETQLDEMKPLLPFMQRISNLEDERRKLLPINPAQSALNLNRINDEVKVKIQEVTAGKIKVKRTVAYRAARNLEILRTNLKSWYRFYEGYDPEFTWWNSAPYKALVESLGTYEKAISERIVGIAADDKTTIIGDPIGREALIEELQYEMIPYTPEQLVEIADKEFAWCEVEMKKAAREMGFGDDWKKALEKVKNDYVEPGKQPELIRDQAYEAIEYVEKNNLVTVDKIARNSWRMEMMSPERQLISPFFLGGETILVSYPTDTMTQEQKMMSMRGNNKHFTRAVTHHELIPGHHLQGFMSRRYRPYRQIYYTPFSVEGWALYWEFLLWDRGFNKTPEDRVGALFWRMHRCARIIFSLNFHLEKMTPQEAVDFLVERVGHERDNATAEVRRSFIGSYGPLYQMAYMMGGLQFYALHEELVASGKMTDKQFHDAILKQGPIPVEMVRAILTNQPLTKDFKTGWRYYRGL
ncbi:MAG: DUF885 family protein [Pyrinomonadaceae bacterium]